MKEKRGFTLIEILVVVGILATILTIVLVVIGNTNKKAQEKLLATKISTIEIGAKLWAQDNIDFFYSYDKINDNYNCTEENEKVTCDISYKYIADEGYIKYDGYTKEGIGYITDPVTKEDMSKSYVKITFDKKNKKVTKIEVIKDEIVIESVEEKFNCVTEDSASYKTLQSLSLINYLNCDTPDYTLEESTTLEKNIFAAKDNDGTSYYFRGDTKNNYVKFKGKTYRIIRINGDGSLRIIYDDTIDITATNTLNYTNSDLKNKLNTWYENNIGESEAVANGKYCNDIEILSNKGIKNYASYARAVNYSPTLKCASSNQINGKVGTITSDEVILAGAKYNTENKGFYLNKGVSYWTMSAGTYNYYGEESPLMMVNETGSLQAIKNGNLKVAPVINLTAEYARNLVGTGTNTNPFRARIGLDNRTYTENEIINFLGLDWYVIKDNDISVRLVLIDNYKTGKYGNDITYENSNIYNKLNDDFKNTYLLEAINEDALIIQGVYNSEQYYVNIPTKEELSSNRPLTKEENGSSFWTRSSYGNSLYIGSKDGGYVESYFSNIGEGNLYLTRYDSITMYNSSSVHGDDIDINDNKVIVAKEGEWFKANNQSQYLVTTPTSNTINIYKNNNYITKKACDKLEKLNIIICGSYHTFRSDKHLHQYFYGEYYNSPGSAYYTKGIKIYTLNNPDGKDVYYTNNKNACKTCVSIICISDPISSGTIELCTNPITYIVPTEDNTIITSTIGYRPVIEVKKR